MINVPSELLLTSKSLHVFLLKEKPVLERMLRIASTSLRIKKVGLTLEAVDGYVSFLYEEHKGSTINNRPSSSLFSEHLSCNKLLPSTIFHAYFVLFTQNTQERLLAENPLVEDLIHTLATMFDHSDSGMEAIKQHLNQQQQMLDTLQDVIIVMDRSGRLIKWNKQLRDKAATRISIKPGKQVATLFNNIPEEKLQRLMEEGKSKLELQFRGNMITDKLFTPHIWRLTYRPSSQTFILVGKDISKELDLQQELIVAGEVQKSFLPAPVANKQVTIKTIYEAANYVSGDGLGYLWLDNGKRLFIYLLDVMGHGVPAAIQTSAMQLLVEQVGKEPISLSAKLQKINTKSVEILTSDYFAAAIIVELDVHTGVGSYTSAGINHFVYSHKGIIKKVKTPGSFLGLFPNIPFEENEICFNSGDHLHLVTDGLFDSIDAGILQTKGSYHAVYQHLKTLAHISHEDDATAVSIFIK
ncbi:serine/threonine-protein phosphatase [Paenalkalicoccus suaedae]|uniref:Serine/threonine-protein phosphatase n=1 Tax=Paenalkalicoccus suaedae TaxID=2592382 RepID=A0A859FA79_9BACI|nr:PP2C family protein-serine/threonine phosphatase [Paenalkalicoccus suaedae]QKS70163.1 serine/threonine-protein phosphatase [Paenalkalicoccus suaedae]